MNDIFVLKKNSWHTKLMKFIWNYNYTDFPNMCPYFWLTVFNCLLVIVGCIPYGIYRIFKPLFITISNTTSDISSGFEQYCQDRKKNWLDNFVNSLLSEDPSSFEKLEKDGKLANNARFESQILYYARYTSYNRSELSGFDKETLDKIFTLRENFKRWDALQEVKRHQRELFLSKQRNREQIAKQEAIERRKKIGQITVKLKFLFKIIGGLMAAGSIYLLGFFFYKIGIWLFGLNYTALLPVLLKMTIIVVSAFTIVGFVFLLVKSIRFLSCKFGKYCIPCENRRNKLNNFFKWLFIDNLVMNNLYKLSLYLVNGIKEFFAIIKMLYKNNCPGIHWE